MPNLVSSIVLTLDTLRGPGFDAGPTRCHKPNLLANAVNLRCRRLQPLNVYVKHTETLRSPAKLTLSKVLEYRNQLRELAPGVTFLMSLFVSSPHTVYGVLQV